MKRLPLSIYIALVGGSFAAADETLVSYTVENAVSIPAPLTGEAGSAPSGASLFAASGCADCHRTPDRQDGPRVGPDLSNIAERRSEGEIRLSIVNPTIRNDQTVMPAYYAIGETGQAPDDLVGRTRLTATEIEDLVAWMLTLKN